MRLPLLSWVFFVPICSILLSIGVASGQCLGDQRSLLLQLKNSLVFRANGTNQLAKWDQTSDCCSWDGVRCDEAGRVAGLNLRGKSISGGISDSSLFNLGFLDSLDLSFNSFENSAIPARIGNLTSLRYLNLSNAGFGGQIPGEMSKLTRLVVLDISALPLLQISVLKLENPNLGELIENMSELEELYLDGMNVSAPGSEWCEALSSSVLNLRVLSLTNCYLSGPIDSSLEKLHSLSVIRLEGNNLSSTVPEFFSKFSNLTTLHLPYCELYGKFPKEVFLVPTLQVVNLFGNDLLEGSFPTFPQLSALQRLVISHTNFSGKLPTSFGNLWNLSRLELNNCHFNGTLPNTMEKLTQLVYVDLSYNELIGSVPSFKMSKNLIQIILSHNSFSGAIPSSHWQGLDKLVALDFRNNLLNGTIPSSLFSLRALETVQLSFNRFEGQLPEFENVSSSRLDTLDLSNNNLQGPIPMSIQELRSLSVFSLSSNKLNGITQLSHFQVFHNLTTLDLSYNNLTVKASGNDSIWLSSSKISTLKLASCKLTTFPNLKNHSKLINLDLSDNQIHGEIPNWIWELGNGLLSYLNLSHNRMVGVQESNFIPTYMSVLDLHHNQLTGNLPILPRFAIHIDLSVNNFTSRIPIDIGNYLVFTIYFSLSDNRLTGGIPESVCNASYLQVLDLSNNSFTGKIPRCVSTIRTLGVLNLRRNIFRGEIPDAFPVNCALETIDLNGNSIDGKIPKSLANCTKLEVLDLGNNMLTGDFPCLLKNISTLRVLVMRSNRFRGNIGCRNSTGVWARLQIIDLAHNNFSGILRGECLTKWKAMMNEQKVKHLQFEFLDYTPSRYYQDAVTVTFKGQEMKLQKILTLFTSVDLSCNNFSGQIPKEMGELRALYFLNLSHNTLTGEIPPSTGNLQQLESLDLSSNFLSGEIPQSLTSLNFLQLLNLSFNHLVGKIPTGQQFSTFRPESYSGNKGLCGFPLSVNCSDSRNLPGRASSESSLFSDIEIDWRSIYGGIGFGVGAGAVFALRMMWHEGRYWFEDRIDIILLKILPWFGYSYRPRDERYDDDDDGSYSMEDHREVLESDSLGKFCVFCSKLDMSRRRAVHDLRCTCFSSPVMSSSFSSSSSSSLQ